MINLISLTKFVSPHHYLTFPSNLMINDHSNTKAEIKRIQCGDD